MISPGRSVLEFGAGALRLPTFLPPGCKYTPSDIVARSPNTLVCDLNSRPLSSFAYHDVIVFSGVLEYLTDCHSVIEHVRHFCREIIASYAVLREPLSCSYLKRRTNGWFNDYSEEELRQLFLDHSFKCIQTKEWQQQIIFRFTQLDPTSHG
jgi:hypothetical protein